MFRAEMFPGADCQGPGSESEEPIPMNQCIDMDPYLTVDGVPVQGMSCDA